MMFAYFCLFCRKAEEWFNYGLQTKKSDYSPQEFFTRYLLEEGTKEYKRRWQSLWAEYKPDYVEEIRNCSLFPHAHSLLIAHFLFSEDFDAYHPMALRTTAHSLGKAALEKSPKSASSVSLAALPEAELGIRKGNALDLLVSLEEEYKSLYRVRFLFFLSRANSISASRG